MEDLPHDLIMMVTDFLKTEHHAEMWEWPRGPTWNWKESRLWGLLGNGEGRLLADEDPRWGTLPKNYHAQKHLLQKVIDEEDAMIEREITGELMETEARRWMVDRDSTQSTHAGKEEKKTEWSTIIETRAHEELQTT